MPNLTELLSKTPKTTPDSTQTLLNWAQTVKPNHLFPVTKSSVELSLQKQSPTQVYKSLLQDQDIDNSDRSNGRNYWRNIGVGLLTSGLLALKASPRAGVVAILLGIGTWYFGTRANWPRNDV